VATDQKISLAEAESNSVGSVIENELPAYRAISRLAVFSLVFGFLALFSFAHWFFYLFALLALVAGVAANLNIKRFPDILTGRGLANAGIAMGLTFGLASATITTVQGYVRAREAEKFAKKYAVVLKASSPAEAMWWTMYPSMRKDKTPPQFLEEFEAAKGRERMQMDQKMANLNKIRSRLSAAKGEDIHFLKIESTGIDESRTDLGIFGVAVFELEGPGSEQFPEKQQLAAAVMKATPKGQQYDWWVEDLIFPYKSSTFVAPVKPVDDGHGHPH
jgi:hypothetical protein